MAGANFLDHNLVSVDPSILSCWEEKVKEGFDCTLLLKHSKGKVTTILKCSKLVASSDARNSVPQPAVSPTQVEVAKRKKKRRKMSKKKLESLLSYQERLAREKGLPPSRLMLQHAAVVPPLPASKEFQCDQWSFLQLPSKHKGCKHKKSEEPETLREMEQNQSRNLSQASGEREELFPVNADTAVVGDLSPPFVPKHKCPSYLCSKFRCPKETAKQERHWQEMQEFLDRQGYDTTSYQRSEDSL